MSVRRSTAVHDSCACPVPWPVLLCRAVRSVEDDDTVIRVRYHAVRRYLVSSFKCAVRPGEGYGPYG